jgi:hypothetical protein
VTTNTPSLSVTARVAAAPVRRLKAREDLPIATDRSAAFGNAALERHGAGADAA